MLGRGEHRMEWLGGDHGAGQESLSNLMLAVPPSDLPYRLRRGRWGVGWRAAAGAQVGPLPRSQLQR